MIIINPYFLEDQKYKSQPYCQIGKEAQALLFGQHKDVPLGSVVDTDDRFAGQLPMDMPSYRYDATRLKALQYYSTIDDVIYMDDDVIPSEKLLKVLPDYLHYHHVFVHNNPGTVIAVAKGYGFRLNELVDLYNSIPTMSLEEKYKLIPKCSDNTVEAKNYKYHDVCLSLHSAGYLSNKFAHVYSSSAYAVVMSQGFFNSLSESQRQQIYRENVLQHFDGDTKQRSYLKTMISLRTKQLYEKGRKDKSLPYLLFVCDDDMSKNCMLCKEDGSYEKIDARKLLHN